jgi:hypothetical protein
VAADDDGKVLLLRVRRHGLRIREASLHAKSEMGMPVSKALFTETVMWVCVCLNSCAWMLMKGLLPHFASTSLPRASAHVVFSHET